MNNKKKILGAVLSSLVYTLFIAMYLTLIIYFQITETEKIPAFIFVLLVIVLSVPIIGIIINLIMRINEIKSGEEEKSSKY